MGPGASVLRTGRSRVPCTRPVGLLIFVHLNRVGYIRPRDICHSGVELRQVPTYQGNRLV
jgi:hypothetical protein